LKFVNASALSRIVAANSAAVACHSLWFTWSSVSARRYRKMASKPSLLSRFGVEE